MNFTVVMASTLESYPNAAKNRETKIFRAIDSVLNQSYQNFQLFIVADGCQKTYDMVKDKHEHTASIRCSLVPKQPHFSGKVRNFGIHNAAHEWICYLDIDDFLGINHLKNIKDSFEHWKHKPENTTDPNWIFFNDWIFRKTVAGWVPQERQCHHQERFHNGTSNICHKKTAGLWKSHGYLHDYHFIQELGHYNGPPAVIRGAEYYVCHIPNRYDI